MSTLGRAKALVTCSVASLALVNVAWAGMSCDDIMNMVDHNVPASIVVDTMASSGTEFSSADLQCLRQRGAPADVLAKATEMKAPEAPKPAADEAMPDEEEAPKSRFDEAESLGSGDLFDEDEASGSEGGAGGSELDSYIRDYKAKKYRTASYGLFQLLQDNAYPEKDSTIKYYLAKSLQDLGMLHAAQYYYMEVVRKGPRNPLFKHALPRLAQIAAYTGNDYELLRVVGRIAPESFPRQAKPHLYYLLGRKAYESDELAEATEMFDKIPQGHELYPRAQYFVGLINYQRQKFQSAARSFREVIRSEVVTEDVQLGKELEDLKDLSLINIARIYYGLQRFENADSYYAKVERDSAYWPQALFERAWTNFWLGDLNDSLGYLLTADSPFFTDDQFIPDTRYLRALIYFQLCEYDEVDRVVQLFQAKYGPMRDEMKEFVNQVRESESGGSMLFDKAYDAYFGAGAGPSKLPSAMFTAMLRDRDLSALVRHMDMMDSEVSAIDSQTAQWRDSIGQELVKIIARDRQRYKEKAGRVVAQSMLDEYRTVDNLLQDSDVLLFEVADARRSGYMYQLSNPNVDALDEKPYDFATSPNIIYWPFNGEFWSDELAFYRYSERGSCK